MKESKKMLAIALITLSFIYSCGNSNNSNSNENKDSLANNEINTSLIIEARMAGQIQIGQSIDKIAISGTQKLTKDKITRNLDEGEVIVETIHTLVDDGEEMLKITGDKVVEDIAIVSNKYKTKNGIGVSSSVDEFIKAYPDYEILYSYIAGNLWLETKTIDVQFKIDIENYTGTEEKLMEGDLVKLDTKQLKKDTKINEIRIY